MVSTNLSSVQAPCMWSEHSLPRILQCYRPIIRSPESHPPTVEVQKGALLRMLRELAWLLSLRTKSCSHLLMQRSHNLNQGSFQIHLMCQQLSRFLHLTPKPLPSGAEYLAVCVGGYPVARCWHAGVKRLPVHVQWHGMLGLICTESALFRAEVRPAKEIKPI